MFDQAEYRATPNGSRTYSMARPQKSIAAIRRRQVAGKQLRNQLTDRVPGSGNATLALLQAGTQGLAESVRPGITRQAASHLVHDVGKADPVLEVSVGQRTPGARVAEGLR
jgi:hypothetical protein